MGVSTHSESESKFDPSDNIYTNLISFFGCPADNECVLLPMRACCVSLVNMPYYAVILSNDCDLSDLWPSLAKRSTFGLFPLHNMYNVTCNIVPIT